MFTNILTFSHWKATYIGVGPPVYKPLDSTKRRGGERNEVEWLWSLD
jgi:hypothetical protein